VQRKIVTAALGEEVSSSYINGSIVDGNEIGIKVVNAIEE